MSLIAGLVPALPRALLAAGVAAFLASCATPPPASDPDALADYRATNDPWEPTNRFFYKVDNGLDTVILRPLAKAYLFVFPEVVRDHTHDFLANLSTPVTLADDMLQGKPRRAGDTFMRLVLNTTVGVGGLFDVATGWGWPAHDTDFGVTLAIWGIGEGPFLFLPLYGPSNPRDGIGIGGDALLDPFTWAPVGNLADDARYARFGVSGIDAYSRHIDDIDSIKKTALDPYATFRSLYRQHRAAQITETRADNRATTPAWYPHAPETSAAPTPGSVTTPTPGTGLQGSPEVK